MLEEIIAPLLSTKWGQRSGLAAVAIFSLCSFITLVEIPIIWHGDYVLAHAQTTIKSFPSLTNHIGELIMQIPDRHLFGMSGKRAAGLPITSLELRLVGVVQGNSESASRAMISEASRAAKIYHVGDSLTPGVYIKAITPDSVILENDNHIEKLPLLRPPLRFHGIQKNLLLGD
ncbi:MAG: hypothetical protein K0S27_788 [Gammaproteobacteria bacterium]|nr:hypothetical protein [Gammaproteobacteria bacterium]